MWSFGWCTDPAGRGPIRGAHDLEALVSMLAVGIVGGLGANGSRILDFGGWFW